MRYNRRGEADDIVSIVIAYAIAIYLVICFACQPDHAQCNTYGTETKTEVIQVRQNGENDYLVNYVDPETRVVSSERFFCDAIVKADVENDKPPYVSKWTYNCMFYSGQTHENENIQIHIHKDGKMSSGFRSGKGGGPVTVIE